MGLLLEGMRSAVDRLLQQSLQWGRIEMANQEKKTAMRTNKASACMYVWLQAGTYTSKYGL